MAPPVSPPAGRPTARIVAVAAGLQALLQISTDIYLAGMTAIGRDFGVGVAGVQRTMVAFSIGLALAHLAIGGLADHFGRKPVAFAGLSLYLAATLAGLIAPSLEALIAARLVQGMAAAAGPILMRAVLRDAFERAEAPRYFSLVGTFAGIAPVTAPLLGAAAIALGGWRACFAVLLVYGALLLLAIATLLPETLRPSQRAVSRLGAPFAVSGRLAASVDFRAGATAIFCGYGGLFAWLSTGPFLLGERLGLDTLQTALVYGLGSAGFLAGNWLSVWLVGRVPTGRILLVAGCFGLLGSAIFLAATLAGRPAFAVVVLLVQPYYLAFGMIQPLANALAMRSFPDVAGQASSWFGICQQLGAASFSMLAVLAGAGPATLAVMALGMAGVAVSGLLASRSG